MLSPDFLFTRFLVPILTIFYPDSFSAEVLFCIFNYEMRKWNVKEVQDEKTGLELLMLL